jgi:LAGLIDADG endonuclease
MVIFSILFFLLSNAVTLRRDKSILFSRVAITVLLYSSLIAFNGLYFSSLESGIGLYSGLFHATTTTHVFHIFIFLIGAAILQLTAFYPRKVWIAEYSSISKLFLYNFLYCRSKIVNKMGEQFKIIEYPERQYGTLSILWGKLSNSGNLLKLLIPNLVELYRGGWTNYSGTETTHKMTLRIPRLTIKYISDIYLGLLRKSWKNTIFSVERSMDYRGSKSNYMFVKEQRVDGSWFTGSCAVNLRYTLRGFEIITWAGIPSNQIINKRLYSTTNKSKIIIQPKLSTIDEGSLSLNPWFITGFIDGDGSFTVYTAKKKSGTGWKIQPILTIGLDPKDLDLLVQIKAFFKVGKIYTSKRGIIYYTVGSTKDLIKYILPHFYKYPLATAKLKDYLIFKEILLLMQKGEHNSLPGLLKIFSLRANLNKGLPDIIKSEFPDIIPAVLPEFNISSYFNPHWLSGFIVAEGSFFISIYKDDKRKTGYAVSLAFSLSQHVKDIELLERLAKYLKCGRISEASNRETAEWIISRSDDINLKLIPFLTNYTLSGVKLLDYERFKKASILIEKKMHLTPEGVTLIKALKDAMYKM